MPDVHARLSASGAKRWLACPRSVKLEECFPEVDTEFSVEGTRAHALAEHFIRLFIKEGRRPESLTDVELAIHPDDGEPVPLDMKNAVLKYLNYVVRIHDELAETHKDVMMFCEVKVDFSNYVRDGFGTCDCCIIAGEILHIIDYKHGRGVEVECKGNPQPRLYALGALNEFGWIYPIKHVHTHIVQPRIGNYDSEYLDVDFLRMWGEDIKPLAERAWNDEGDFNPSEEVCKFCKAKHVCRARAKDAINAINQLINLGRSKEEK